MAKYIDIIVHVSDEVDEEIFVEIEDPNGYSVSIGESRVEEKGFRRIRITPQNIMDV